MIRDIEIKEIARDIYDIWYISKIIDFTQALDIFSEKCEIKRLTPDINHIIRRKEDFLNAWNSSLRHQLKDLPEFKPIFSEVIELLNNIKLSD